MSTEEKLVALIDIAIDNGWDEPFRRYNPVDRHKYFWKTYDPYCNSSLADGLYRMPGEGWGCPDWPLLELIYSKEFAKALFGVGSSCPNCGMPPKNTHRPGCTVGGNIWDYLWEYHLSRAVISDDPVDYMYQVVKKKPANQEPKMAIHRQWDDGSAEYVYKICANSGHVLPGGYHDKSRGVSVCFEYRGDKHWAIRTADHYGILIPEEIEKDLHGLGVRSICKSKT